MLTPKALLASLLLASGASVLPTISWAAVNIDIDVAPPAPRVEVAPPPRAGFVWAPGFWEWRGGSHVWVQGHWLREHRFHHWVPEHWVQVGRRYHFERGHWQHD